MSEDPSLRAYGGDEPEPSGAAPHLADYWQVVTRRFWLVLLIFGVTTASAIWAVSRQRTFFQSMLAMQVNDPIQSARGLVGGARVSGMDIYVDPVQSEIQVLRSAQIARAVVDSLGMRLTVPAEEVVRSQLARDRRVAESAPDGRYELAYDAQGRSAQFRSPEGQVLGTAQVGTVLDAGMVRFTLQPPPQEARSYQLAIRSAESVLGEVRNNLSATPRPETNIIDVYYLSADPVLAPRALNAAVAELRALGARRVARKASSDIDFIEARLDSAREDRRRSASRIQDFQSSQAFSNLSAREQTLVNRLQQVNERIQALQGQRAALTDLARRLQIQDAEDVDYAPVLATLPEQSNPQVRSLIDQIRDRQAEIRRLLTEDQLAAGHPQIRAMESEIAELGDDLTESVTARLEVLDEELADLREEETEIQREQEAFPDLRNRLDALQQQKKLDDEMFSYLRSQLSQAQIVQASASPYVEIIDPAVGSSPIQPGGRVNVFLGALLGLILGVGTTFFLEYLDRTVRTSSDVETLLGIPVLGVIPRLRRLADFEEEDAAFGGKGLPLVVAMDPLDPAAEAYRNLRMNLMFMGSDDEPIRTVLLSSPGPGEGKSTTAVNFAVMLAQQGQRVLLIDADLRRPALHRALDLLREPGLTNLLVGDAEPREAIRPSVLPNLDVLPSGPFPPNPSELLNSKTMERLLDEFEGKYSQIIIDSPPILAVTDAAILATHADGAVVVLRSGETEQRAAERSVDQLRRLGCRVFGAVLNEVSTASTDDSYYLQYYYSYHPSQSGWDRLRQGLSKARFW